CEYRTDVRLRQESSGDRGCHDSVTSRDLDSGPMAAPVPGSARPRPPRTASSAVPSAPPSAPLSKAPARPILVVDDDAKIVALVRAYLEREGFRVRIAGDGP